MTNDLDEALTRTLREHAGDAGTPRLDLDAVRGRARRIRRTRTALVGAGAAAVVLAVVAPLGLLGGGSSDRSVDPATSGTASADIPVERGGTLTLDLDDLAEGSSSRAPYALGGVLHLAPGVTWDLPGGSGAQLGAVVPVSDGWLATVADVEVGAFTLYRLDSQGSLVEEVSGPSVDGRTVSDALAVDAATGRVAWVEYDLDPLADLPSPVAATLVTAGRDGTELGRTDLPVNDTFAPSSRPLGFTSAGVLVNMTDSMGEDRTLLAGFDGTAETVADRATEGVSPGGDVVRRTGAVGQGDEACSGVFGPDGKALAWSTSTCTASYGRYSPDGQLLLRGPVEEPVVGDGQVDAVIDPATGDVVVALAGAGPDDRVYAGAWESATSLVVAVQKSDDLETPARYALVRVDVAAGRAELASAIVDYDPQQTGYTPFTLR
ncbi:hypothetical protein [Nocardioides zeae]|uniref:Uncharacterized protein n=1 Tax=Nocardioides zeae TaxID=1457234 RepID=A0A6P0HJ30_9ACTN|nr:hypothetical protein [Nocardioides zeae]NEN78611.1 hypothetical protein [Nocardioides zeae]